MRATAGKVVGLLYILIVLVAWPAAGQAPPAPDPQKPAAKSPQEEYKALLERVKASDKSVDFGKMRQLQTQLESYDPYGDIESDPFEPLRSGNFKEAKVVAGQMIEANYLDVKAHIAAAAAAEKLGDKDAATHHQYVVKGIIDSIFKSGDGRTTETAFKVITVDEEYALLQSQGLRVAGQSLVNDEKHSYDVLNALDPISMVTQEVYFNIDPIMQAADKMFSP
ncbi:MAG TPA: DUF4919 domain-containing protein [Thermoanaerobaculia bacterium]|nr:DUF4919 domain-containing protein [Thermoanaerobaculia bacterium]